MIVHAELKPSLLVANQKIAHIEIFICNLPTYLAANSPRIIWLHLYSSGLSGWASCHIPPAYRHVDPLQWASIFSRWRGLSVEECLEFVYLHDDSRNMIRKELAKSALLNMYDSAEKYNRVNHLELMNEATSYCYYKIN